MAKNDRMVVALSMKGGTHEAGWPSGSSSGAMKRAVTSSLPRTAKARQIISLAARIKFSAYFLSLVALSSLSREDTNSFLERSVPLLASFASAWTFHLDQHAEPAVEEKCHVG
ncbi:MAG: hypothetical protein LBR80_12505, partial [Deltaproteobacteria bacterium]|nr:hypothetical protein [Deltaproteobacteria bacterium]